MTGSLSTLSAGLFAPALEEVFTLRGADGWALVTTLARCSEHPRATMPGSGRVAFNLVFSCPAEAAGAVAGGSCLVSHTILGTFGPLYVERILPVGFPPDTAAFQAIFN